MNGRFFLFSSAQSLCRRVGIDPVNDTLAPRPQGQVREDLHNAPLISKGRLLEHGQIFHHSVVNDVLHDLIDKVDLSAVQISPTSFSP